MNKSISLFVMEDVKHHFVWETIIDILIYIRENEIKSDFQFKTKHPVSHEDILMDIFMYNTIDSLKWTIVYKTLKETIRNACYLCQYNYDVYGCPKEQKYIDCTNCPSKIDSRNGCLGGAFQLVWNISFSSIASILDREFETIVDGCKKIKNTEFKDDVVCRSEVI